MPSEGLDADWEREMVSARFGLISRKAGPPLTLPYPFSPVPRAATVIPKTSAYPPPSDEGAGGER